MSVRYYSGERIYFRPIEAEDCARLTVWVNDPANWRTLARFAPINQLREKERFIDGLYKSETDIVLGIAACDGDVLVGCCGLRGISAQSRSATFGILIGECKGQGFGSEATRLMVRYGFEELNLNRIDLVVFADNERGLRAYRRAGFLQEGRLRQAYYRNGRYVDAIQMAILREDWELQRREASQDAALSSMAT